MLEKDTLEEEYEGDSISYHIDLKKLKSYNKNDELKELLEIFVKEDTEELGGSIIMEEAKDELERLSQDENIIGLYDAEIMQEKWEKSIKEEMKEEGLKEGLKEGIKKGIEQGIKEGINQRNIEIAKEMLSKNMNMNLISELTHLSIDEIKNLL